MPEWSCDAFLRCPTIGVGGRVKRAHFAGPATQAARYCQQPCEQPRTRACGVALARRSRRCADIHLPRDIPNAAEGGQLGVRRGTWVRAPRQRAPFGAVATAGRARAPWQPAPLLPPLIAPCFTQQRQPVGRADPLGTPAFAARAFDRAHGGSLRHSTLSRAFSVRRSEGVVRPSALTARVTPPDCPNNRPVAIHEYGLGG